MVFSDHWHYGRWSVATASIIWFPGNIYYVLLPIWVGLEGSGALKALMNLASPALQSISALSLILLPVLVRSRKESGTLAMANTMRSFLALFLFGSTLYLALLLGLRSEIFRLFYAGKYTEYASWPLLLAGVLPLGGCVTAALSNSLRALERPDWVFWCYLGSSMVALLVGIPLIITIGVTGALLGQVFSSLTAGALMSWFYRRFLREKAKLGA
jgi:O-antigen/teichoic acid export membrane protein